MNESYSSEAEILSRPKELTLFFPSRLSWGPTSSHFFIMKKKIFIPPWIEVWCYYTRWFLLKFHGTMTLLHFLRMDFKTQWPKLPNNGSLKFEGSICHMEEAPESPETYWVLALTVYPWCFPDVFLLPPTRHKLKVKVNQATPIRHVLCMEGCQWDMVGHGEGGKKISVILNKFRWA